MMTTERRAEVAHMQTPIMPKSKMRTQKLVGVFKYKYNILKIQKLGVTCTRQWVRACGPARVTIAPAERHTGETDRSCSLVLNSFQKQRVSSCLRIGKGHTRAMQGGSRKVYRLQSVPYNSACSAGRAANLFTSPSRHRLARHCARHLCLQPPSLALMRASMRGDTLIQGLTNRP